MVIIIIAVIVLSYFNFDLRGLIESPQAQENFAYVWGWVVYIWNEYLSSSVLYFWNEIFLNVIWEMFTEGLQSMKDGNFIPYDVSSMSKP